MFISRSKFEFCCRLFSYFNWLITRMIGIRHYDDGMWGDDITVTLLHHSGIGNIGQVGILEITDSEVGGPLKNI